YESSSARSRRVVRRQDYTRYEFLMERAKADRDLVNLDGRALALAHARCGAPRQELRVPWHIGHEIKELSWSESHDLSLSMPGGCHDGSGLELVGARCTQARKIVARVIARAGE